MPDATVTLAQELIRHKRDGHALDRARIDAFVRGLADGSWNDAQVGAMAMAIFMRGLSDRETTDLTDAMTRSGVVLDWKGRFDAPIVDKHSTGGVGDKVSLALAPIVAACGGVVPMISGRGLGHTGGTLDKLEAIPGYRAIVTRDELESVLRAAGCAIVGASSEVAPADRRLYAIRDVTSTVESIPLISASILSKKLAAGLDALVLDVKVGNGAFAHDLAFAQALARSIARVAAGAGLACTAWITDMNQVLGRSCGNAVETLEAVRYLQGKECDPRFGEVTETLSAELLVMGKLAPDMEAARVRVRQALASGAALERFSRMVTALGGPADFVEHAERHLPAAPVQRTFHAASAGYVQSIATREMGLAVIELGGGRRGAGDAIDPRVGFTQVAAPGDRVESGSVLAVVHAATEAHADAALARLTRIIHVGDVQPSVPPVLIERASAAPNP
ncbi:Thymidine phosphorylase [Usitatibacter palustris]|uniref:Thymidine phosphorylase n=2 Tax=Usitatibacter palustris TaxID=2732487 RepID=A0A6M4HBD1_9PROT|nr:Thymidine phosphorylase [Usitatibacter palustris]